MDKKELAEIVLEGIKDKVSVFNAPGMHPVTYNMYFDPCLNIMQETDDGERLRFVITIEDVTENKDGN